MRQGRLFMAILVITLFLTCQAGMGAASDDIAQADALYSGRRDMANVRAGINLLQKVLQKEPDDYDALWRQARFFWFMGDRAEGKDRLANFEKGRSLAEHATKVNQDGLDGHYWFGALIGCVGQERGILNSLFMVGPMKKEIERCLEIDPKHAESHDVYAQLLWKVPGFAGGSTKRAQEEARLAVTYGPDAIEHWLHYGQIAAANKDYKTARSALQKAISLPDDPEDPFASQRDKAEARAELKKIEDK